MRVCGGKHVIVTLRDVYIRGSIKMDTANHFSGWSKLQQDVNNYDWDC